MKQINNSFLEVKKSKFYGYLYEINGLEEVQEILDETKKNNKKCKHIVYSYILLYVHQYYRQILTFYY